VWVGSAGLIAYAAAYLLLNFLLPPDSFALTFVSDVGIVILEISVILLCWIAFRRGKGTAVRWVWVLVGAWVLGGLVGDGLWTYYEVILGAEVPAPGPYDIGYLSAYVLFAGVLAILTCKTLDRFRAMETTLDAAIFTLGAAGLIWPLVISPALDHYESSLGFWINLAYPMLDLLLVFAFAAVFFGFAHSRHYKGSRVPLSLVCVALLLQVVSDLAYFRLVNTGGEYAAGNWLDPAWVFSYALTGVAVLLGLRAQAGVAPALIAETDLAPLPQVIKPSTPAWRTVAPYVTLPMLAATVVMQQNGGGLHWNRDTVVLLCMGIAMVALLVTRQYLALLRNHRLYADLTKVSVELENKVAALADVNQRLADLNDSAHRLTSLRQSHAVARAGLEIACTFTRSPGGWISLGDSADATVIAWGSLERLDPADPEVTAAAAKAGALRVLRLTVRDENLGTMWLLEPPDAGPEADLLPMISAQLASALDNARRYEEALQLAERDPLTGLFNHRGIHRRLAGEALRAQQAGTELSLIMIDLDDFKVLNDTYGHAAGDSVLRQVSDAIGVVLRHADLAGRVGGDELLLVLPNTGSEGAMQLSERLRIALAARPYVTIGGHSIPVYLSLGVATLPEDATSVGQLLEVADAHLYASKQLGGNTTTGSATTTDIEGEERGILGVAARLLDAVGARDHYTRRHSEHVVHHALSLGEAMGLPEQSLRTLHVAAMLHDVGKIGVPADLLRRPAALSPVDEQIVREHVLLGSEVILDMPRLAEVAAIVSAHHEHWDGLGYPYQNAGEDIPVLSRILAVADAYSAMTLDRPYRNSLTRAQAREELQKAAGSQLDPDLVRRFIEVLDTQENRAPGEQAAAS
jgi:diguanylate cyclase (GGDEF)-like protein